MATDGDPGPDWPSIDVLELGRRLERQLRRARSRIGEGWLKSFAGQNRRDIIRARSDPAAARRMSDALGRHLDELGLLAPAAEFLALAPRYFGDASIPERERWGLRSQLCDLELIEYFCDEHKIPWCLPDRVSTCAGPWDEPVRPWEHDLLKARSWGRHRESSERGYFPGNTLDESWRVPEPALGEALLVWYRGRRWRSGLLLDVLVNRRLRRLLRYDPTDNFPGVFPIHRVTFELEGKIHHDFVQVPHPDDPRDQAYLGLRVPGSFWSDDLRIDLRMIDVPLSSVGPADPILYQRYVSLVTGVEEPRVTAP